jgi:pimeloyl-ACP methyl ester carboxylesterase
MMAASDPHGAAAALRGRARRPDDRPVLESFGGPVFVCTGTHDAWSTPDVTAQLVECLADPDVLLLPEVGHLPNVEAPDAFNARLRAFLDRAEPRRG